MRMAWRWFPVVAASAAVAACGEDGGTGGGPSVELQVLAGIAFPAAEGNFVHVLTPRTNAFKLMKVGDQTDHENWTKFSLNLEDGDVIRISVINAAEDTLTTGECVATLEGAADASYARAIAFYFAPPNNYVDCADNLDLP
ncbi:MAG TPA: hypothetical protein VJ773_02400 [Gemmatimonadales bacterium]|nr:hypothetical protein [Gemmatimonadales bacterium]